MEGQLAADHEGQGATEGNLQGPHDTLGLPCAVVVGDDGDGRVVQAEQGHEEEALELEVDAEDAGSSLAHGLEAQQDLVHGEVGDGADAVHDGGGDADGQDGTDGFPLGLDAVQMQLDVGVELVVEEDRQTCGHELAQDGGNCRTGGAHSGDAQPLHAEDEHGVHDDVGDGAGALGDHGVHGTAGGLEQPLEEDGQEGTLGEDAADAGVGDAGLGGGGAGVLHLVVGTDAHEAEDHKGDHADDGQEHAVAGGQVGHLLIPLAQALTQQGVDADADTNGAADLQVLDGECQGQGGDGVLGHPGDVDAVDHVVQCLHQHGNDHGHGHVKQQLAHRHHAHFVFS